MSKYKIPVFEIFCKPHADELLLDSEVLFVVLGIENYFDGEKNLKLFTLALP